MSVLEFRYNQRSDCEKDLFCSFVTQHGSYSPAEIHWLQTTILGRKLSRVLSVSVTLAIWSMLAVWVDAVLLPTMIVYIISLPAAQYYPLLIPLVWAVANALLKYVYVNMRLGDAVKLRDRLLAVLPYAGSAFLLKD